MKAIHMIDDYRRMCKEAEYVGKFEAYKAYTQKYHGFFNGVFKYLYCQPIENMRAMIEYADFNNLLKVAEDNYKAGMVDCALACINTLIERFHVDFGFSFLLGLELSNIGGCATPSDVGDPYLYIGIDKPLSKEWIEVFIPHEVFHMLRYRVTKDSAQETVFSRTIEEGLASYASLWIHRLEWNVTNVAKTLGVSEKQADNLMKNTDVLLEKLISDGTNPISSETMNEYFVVQYSDVEFPVIGYYVGLYLAHLSVQSGVDFEEFISMPRAKITDMWFNRG